MKKFQYLSKDREWLDVPESELWDNGNKILDTFSNVYQIRKVDIAMKISEEDLNVISIIWEEQTAYIGADRKSFKEGYRLCEKEIIEKILNELCFSKTYTKNEIWRILNKII